MRGKIAGAWIGVTKVIRGVHFVGDTQPWLRDVRLLSHIMKGKTCFKNNLTSQRCIDVCRKFLSFHNCQLSIGYWFFCANLPLRFFISRPAKSPTSGTLTLRNPDILWELDLGSWIDFFGFGGLKQHPRATGVRPLPLPSSRGELCT